jgi:hypothetical protein
MADQRTSSQAMPRTRGRNSRAKLRLLGLLFLFDILLVAAMLLSFQSVELIEQEQVLYRMQERFDVQIDELVITHTTQVTRVIPYGSVAN